MCRQANTTPIDTEAAASVPKGNYAPPDGNSPNPTLRSASGCSRRAATAPSRSISRDCQCAPAHHGLSIRQGTGGDQHAGSRNDGRRNDGRRKFGGRARHRRDRGEPVTECMERTIEDIATLSMGDAPVIGPKIDLEGRQRRGQSPGVDDPAPRSDQQRSMEALGSDGLAGIEPPVRPRTLYQLEAVRDPGDCLFDRPEVASCGNRPHAEHDFGLESWAVQSPGQRACVVGWRPAGDREDGRVPDWRPDRGEHAVALPDRAIGEADLETHRPLAAGEA